MADERRKGDQRPFHHVRGMPLTRRPAPGQPLRLMPRYGEPLCRLEWLSQHVVKALAWLPLYTAVAVTVVLIVTVFGVPFDGR